MDIKIYKLKANDESSDIICYEEIESGREYVRLVLDISDYRAASVRFGSASRVIFCLFLFALVTNRLTDYVR